MTDRKSSRESPNPGPDPQDDALESGGEGSMPLREDDFEEFAAEEFAAEQARRDAGAEGDGAGDADRLRGELEQWRDTALRARADLENFRKRMAREKSDSIRFANAALLEKLLPIVDNFQMGLDSARAESEKSIVFTGMEMVWKQLRDFLDSEGVEEIEAVGKPFDPNVHDAVSQTASSEVKEGHVISQVRRGYRLRDRLLRPAAVVVSSGPPAPAEAGAKSDSKAG